MPTRALRPELGGHLVLHDIDAVLATYEVEGGRLAATAYAVALVERALYGEVFTAKS